MELVERNFIGWIGLGVNKARPSENTDENESTHPLTKNDLSYPPDYLPDFIDGRIGPKLLHLKYTSAPPQTFSHIHGIN